MKRLVTAAAALVLALLFCPCFAAAEKDFYCEYTKKTETGTLFYIDVFCEREISGAVFELSFDTDKAEFRAVDAFSESSSCRSKAENGILKVSLTDDMAVSSQICRISFKALKTGELTFRLRMIEACDKDLKLLSGFSDDTLTINLGKEDIPDPDDSSAKKTGTSKGSASSSKERGGKSSISEDGDNPFFDGGIFDLRKMNVWGYIAFGAGLVILIAGLVFLGVLIGKKYANKNQPDNKEPHPEGGEDEKADDEASSEESEENPAIDETENNEE